MAKIYLIRHGEPDFSAAAQSGLWGFGRDFAPLTQKGKDAALRAACDERLKGACLIVSSPYTRALQTAQIISSKTGLAIEVDTDLHEWIPSRGGRALSEEEILYLAREFCRHRGECPDEMEDRWETLCEMKERARRAAQRYSHLDKVIFVAHGMILRCFCYIPKIAHAQIIECEYKDGQEDCEYAFFE